MLFLNMLSPMNYWKIRLVLLSKSSQWHEEATKPPPTSISQYLKHHTSGPARRAINLLMATGVRVSDLRLLGMPNLKGNTLTFTTVKTNMLISIDIDQDFADELRGSNQFTFLISKHGAPYKSDKSMFRLFQTGLKMLALSESPPTASENGSQHVWLAMV